MIGVAIETIFFFEIHQVQPVLSLQVILTILPIVVQVEKVVEEEKVVCGVLPSKEDTR